MGKRRSPAVVLVGRPNVGKSTLFNRITATRRAIVTAVPGTTRDLITQPAVWRGVTFDLIDTGGMFGATQDPLHAMVAAAGKKAIGQADVLVFVVDGREGRTSGDDEIAQAVRAHGAPVVVALNKADDRRASNAGLEFYRLGFETVVEVSAEHGTGVGDLLDEIVARLPPRGASVAHGETAPDAEAGAEDAEEARELDDTEPAEVRVAIIGRPNVGKSSLVNRLMRKDLVLVSEVPGTTRDAVDALLRWNRRQFRIVDTAGIRRPGRVARSGQVESLSVIIARRAVEAADVAVLVIDAVEGATEQDGAIGGEAERAGCGIVIAANKWDLVKGQGPNVAETFDAEVRRRMKFLEYAPILHISALTGERTPRLLETVDGVGAARRVRVTTGELNRFIERVTALHPPASPGRKAVRILYAVQVSVAPPTFIFFTNFATTFHFSYQRFLVNRLREEFGFVGTPIRIQVRSRRGEG
ncbi:MAG TPA: ribosome biogenesis GTPase Der [Vicinamibacterales bacterium]|nr:ribosome biogenesis GTPase Der [Vicinamibacterales bacterium]